MQKQIKTTHFSSLKSCRVRLWTNLGAKFCLRRGKQSKAPKVFDTNIKIRNFTKVRRAGNTLKLQPEFVIAW